MRIIVQKFGGTSLATPAYRDLVAERVLAAARRSLLPIVVVSAMGRAGDPYATDTLLELGRQVGADDAPRETDLLMACGEIISAVVLAGTLRRKGLPALVLTGGQAGIVTDRNFSNARILRVQPDHLRRHLDRGDVCVVAGFQGMAETGDITTLGRGGSDTTAAALAVAVRAELVEIYTDVSGVKTADPRIVPEARTLSMLSYEEIFQMAQQGAKVVHPRAVELAMRANVPVRVRSTFDDPEVESGTLITHGFEADTQWDVPPRTVTGVTHLAYVVQCSLDGPPLDHTSTVRIFRLLADAGISVDLINVAPDRRRFIIASGDAVRARRLLEETGFPVQFNPDCAKVSVVGTGMRGVPGVMASVVEALADEGIPILQTADSHVTISCLVTRADMERSVQALHRKFHLEAHASRTED